MSNFRLGLTGALVGALVVLLIHPVTRPFVQNGLWRFGVSQAADQSPTIAQNLNVLPEPSDLVTASLWMSEGCRRIKANHHLTTNELLTFVEIAQASAEREPDNAFWAHTEAIFQQSLGNPEASVRAWKRASRLDQWNDYQNQRLAQYVADLDKEEGRQMAWHWALAYSVKGFHTPALIAQYGLTQLRNDNSLDSRLDLIRSGLLVRDGARSRLGGELGWQMIESGALGTSIALDSRKEFVARRFSFVDQLAQANRNDDAIYVNSVLASNEAWDAALKGIEKQNRPRFLSTQAAIIATLPGSLLLAALASTLVYALGTLFRSVLFKFKEGWLLPAILAAVVGSILFFVTRLTFPTIFIIIVLAGFLIRPRVAPLDRKEFHFDAWMVWASAIIGLMFLVAITGVASFQSPPVKTVDDYADLGLNLIYSRETGLTLAVIFTGALIGLAQVWAYLRRRDPYIASGMALKSMGMTGLVVGIVLGVVTCPLVIAADRQLTDTLSQIVQNEPTYYLQDL